jgi:hypothetical protein
VLNFGLLLWEHSTRRLLGVLDVAGVRSPSVREGQFVLKDPLFRLALPQGRASDTIESSAWLRTSFASRSKL